MIGLDSKYYLDKNETQEYSIETNDNYKLLSGDKVLLNSTLIRRVYNTADKYFTIFNDDETDIETNIGSITTFVKLNNILKFIEAFPSRTEIGSKEKSKIVKLSKKLNLLFNNWLNLIINYITNFN